MNNDMTWFLLMVLVSGLFGRLVKAYPRIPETALPWLVLAAGFAFSFGTNLAAGMALPEAALAGWQGLAAGVMAVGGHESLKGLLVPVLGDKSTKKLLGKLPSSRRP